MRVAVGVSLDEALALADIREDLLPDCVVLLENDDEAVVDGDTEGRDDLLGNDDGLLV